MAGRPDKSTPANIEAEQAVLGALLIDPAAIRRVASKLQPGDFWREKHRWIYGAMIRLFQNETAIDLLTISDFLEAKGFLDKAGGPAYITKLVNETPTSVHLDHYAKIVIDTSRRRKLLDLAGRIALVAADESKPLETVMATVEGDFHEATADMVSGEVASSSDLMSRLYDEVELVTKRQGLAGISTGMSDLDKILGGLYNSDVIYLAARPSVGKTAFMVNLALSAAKADLSVLVISLEMSDLQIAQRMAGIESGLSVFNLRQGKLEGNDWPRLMDAMSRIDKLPIHVAYSGAYRPSQIRAIAHRHRAEHGLDLILIDYLQLMSADDEKGRNRQEQVSSISRDLKLLARALDVPVMGLAQLSRGVESRVDKRPMLSDLRESGALEQDADVVVFLYRHELYEPGAEEIRGQVEGIVAKHRNGPTGTAFLHFRPASGQMVSTKIVREEGGLQVRMPLDEIETV